MADDYPHQKNGFKVFSCFAAGGGSTMGYKLAGYDVIGCLEISKSLLNIYQLNHNSKYTFNEDIRTFKLRNDLPDELYQLDILDGSPPCTPFSVMGKRDKFWGKKKYYKEGNVIQQLDDLFFHFIDLAKKLQPKIIIAENVKGLIIGKAKGYVSEIFTQFKKSFVLDGHPSINEHPKPTEVIGMITDLWFEEKNIFGKIKIFNNSIGKDIKAIIEAGASIGISLRGNGNVERTEEGYDIVKEDFELLGFDFVINPASLDAGVKSYHYEQINKTNGGNEMEKILTVEDLKNQYPDLMKEFADGLQKSFEDNLEELKKEIAEEIFEKMSNNMASAIVDDDDNIKCPYCNKIFRVKYGETQKDAEFDTETGEISTKEENLKMTEHINQFSMQVDKLKEEINYLSKENLILKTKSTVDTMLEGNPYKELIKTKLFGENFDKIPSSLEEAITMTKTEIEFVKTINQTGDKKIPSLKIPETIIDRELKLAGIR